MKSMSHPPSPDQDDTDEASCLSYFSSFNRQSFETTDPHQASEIPDDRNDRVPHPPMRSTITPINIALPSPSDVQAARPHADRKRRKQLNSAAQSGGGGSPSNTIRSSPKGTSASPNPFALNAGPIASLVAQHNHTMLSQLRATPVQSPAIPTIVLQPTLMLLSQEQQVVAAQLQERFFTIISMAGQNGQGPLAVVAPNLQSLAPQPVPMSMPMLPQQFPLQHAGFGQLYQ